MDGKYVAKGFYFILSLQVKKKKKYSKILSLFHFNVRRQLEVLFLVLFINYYRIC